MFLNNASNPEKNRHIVWKCALVVSTFFFNRVHCALFFLLLF